MGPRLRRLGGALRPRLRGWVGGVGPQLQVAMHELHPSGKLLDDLLGVGLHASQFLDLIADRRLLVLPVGVGWLGLG